MHASLILRRNEATRLLGLLNSTEDFPEAAEALDFALRASALSVLPAVAIVTTTKRIDQITEFLKGETNSPEYDSILEALQRAKDSPFFEEPPPISVI
jgi:hypothetical protein